MRKIGRLLAVSERGDYTTRDIRLGPHPCLLTLGRTSKVTPYRGTRNPPWVFDMLQFFQKILPSVQSLWCAQQGELYIKGCGAAEACDVTKDGGHIGFFQTLEIMKKRGKLTFFDAIQVECDIIKQFASFCQNLVFLSLKRVKTTHFYSKIANLVARAFSLFKMADRRHPWPRLP